MPNFFNHVPQAPLQQIFSHFNPKELGNAAQVNTLFRQTAKSALHSISMKHPALNTHQIASYYAMHEGDLKYIRFLLKNVQTALDLFLSHNVNVITLLRKLPNKQELLNELFISLIRLLNVDLEPNTNPVAFEQVLHDRLIQSYPDLNGLSKEQLELECQICRYLAISRDRYPEERVLGTIARIAVACNQVELIKRVFSTIPENPLGQPYNYDLHRHALEIAIHHDHLESIQAIMESKLPDRITEHLAENIYLKVSISQPINNYLYQLVNHRSNNYLLNALKFNQVNIVSKSKIEERVRLFQDSPDNNSRYAISYLSINSPQLHDACFHELDQSYDLPTKPQVDQLFSLACDKHNYSMVRHLLFKYSFETSNLKIKLKTAIKASVDHDIVQLLFEMTYNSDNLFCYEEINWVFDLVSTAIDTADVHSVKLILEHYKNPKSLSNYPFDKKLDWALHYHFLSKTYLLTPLLKLMQKYGFDLKQYCNKEGQSIFFSLLLQYVEKNDLTELIVFGAESKIPLTSQYDKVLNGIVTRQFHWYVVEWISHLSKNDNQDNYTKTVSALIQNKLIDLDEQIYINSDTVTTFRKVIQDTIEKTLAVRPLLAQILINLGINDKKSSSMMSCTP